MCVCVRVCVRVCVSNNGGTLEMLGYADLIERSAGSINLSDAHTNYTYEQIYKTRIKDHSADLLCNMILMNPHTNM